MEDGDTDGDNHSDRDSDKFGNGIVYAMTVNRRNPIVLTQPGAPHCCGHPAHLGSGGRQYRRHRAAGPYPRSPSKYRCGNIWH